LIHNYKKHKIENAVMNLASYALSN